MNRKVVRLSSDNVVDFFKVHSGQCGWCYCCAWWLPTWAGWTDRKDEDNRKLRESIFERGEYDGYLLYLDDVPIGWCQVGQRDRLAKLTSQYKLEPNSEIWAITCFVIRPEFRKKGLMSFMLKAILQDLADKGIKQIQAFPNRTNSGDDSAYWRGAESTFLKSGFKIERDDPTRPILTYLLGQL